MRAMVLKLPINPKTVFRNLNVSTYVILMLFLGYFIVKSIIFGYPWSLACYACKKCIPTCIYGIDPSQLLLAANMNDPNLYISVNNVRLTAKDACAIDENMTIAYNDEKYSLAGALAENIIKADDYVITNELKAKDAAKFCIRCGACQKVCPLNLPITDIVKELAAHN